MLNKILLFFFVSSLIACASYHYEYNFEESRSFLKNKDFAARISIIDTGTSYGQYKNGYNLVITNNSNKDIEIDWNKTSFVFRGQTQQGFMFEGIRYINRNDYKSPSLVMPNSTFSKIIYPNALVGTIMGSTWVNYTIPDGETGVYLVLSVDGKEIKEKLMIIKATKKVFKDDIKNIPTYTISQTKNIDLTTEEINKHYNDYKKNFTSQKEIKAKQILVTDNLLAKEIINKINKGISFDDLAKYYSKDKTNLGYFTKEMLTPELKEVVFSMKEGEISQTPIKSSKGYHIISIEDIRDSKLLTKEEYKPKIQALIAQKNNS